MDDIHKKIREWSRSIKLAEFHGLADEINNVIIDHSSDEINKSIFKLILYVFQNTQQCDKHNTTDSINIFNITCALCSKLTTIPDISNFFSVIYHIVYYLINMKLYKEAMIIGNYLLPDSLFHSLSNNRTDMYVKFSDLWYKTIDKLFTTLQKIDDKTYELLIILIKYDLKFQVLSLRDGSKYLLNKITLYNDKIKSFDQVELYEKFQCTIINYIKNTKLLIGNENKFQTYRSILRYLNDIIIDKIKQENIVTINNNINILFSVFENCMKQDDECYKCFIMYKQLCKILIRHCNEFTLYHFNAMQIYINKMNRIIKIYGYDNAIKWNSYSIIQMVEALILLWDKYKERYDKNEISEKFLINIITLIKHQGNIFPNFPLSNCYCRTSDCQITVDIYNDVTMNLKALKMVSQYAINLSSNGLKIIIETIENCIESICKLKSANCIRWSKLWLIIGPIIYNIAVQCEKINCEETVCLYKILTTTTINLNALNSELSYVLTENPLSVSLHRLSNTYYHHGKYDDAMIICALNAYIGYENDKCKAFRFWTSIKYKYPSSHGINIVNCLKSNKNIGQTLGININLRNCNLPMICLREIKCLQGAEINLSSSIMSVLDLMNTFNVSPLIYGQCVQQLGYHMLNFHSDVIILPYINKALIKLKSIKDHTITSELLIGHLMFYEFIEDLNEINRVIKVEMENSKIKLNAASESNPNGEPSKNIVPAYTLININSAINMSKKLENILKIWIKFYDKMDININEFFESDVMIRTSIVAAEYTRFYQFHHLELEAWKIAYNLSNKFNDYSSIVYITGRCIMSRYINNEWIERAKYCIDKLSVSTNDRTIENIAMFKLSLSEFYFNIGLINEANELFDEAVKLPNIKFTVNLATYLLSVDIQLSHKFNIDYVENIIKGLYTTLTIDDIGSITRHRREECLYELDILFQFTNHITLRMNSLISYREIYAHLARRLSIAQKLGAPLHVADCLKNLCFIDLSRDEFENCEVKLQGLEHILMIESIEMSMKSNISPTLNISHENITSNQIIEPVRDIFHNDTSPILRSKVFASPKFMIHDKKCKCYNCCNIKYQYLVFSSTHIRAKLYDYQHHINHALDHFYGAFNIIRDILNLSSENNGCYHYHHIVEYVLFILDFSRFLKHSISNGINDALNIALHAIEVCEKYNIINSPVYHTAKELIFEFRFENIVNNIDLSKFTMSNTIFTDDNEYFNECNDNVTICTTPVRTIIPNSGQSVRRRKTPPLLSLSKVSVDTIDDNDGINMSNLRPALVDVTVKKKSIKVRPIRREISEDDYLDNESSDDVTPRQTSKKKSLKNNVDNIDKVKMNENKKNTQTKLKLKKKIFLLSDESSGENENVNKIDQLFTKIQISESNNTNSNDKVIIKAKSKAKTKLSLENIPINKCSMKIDSIQSSSTSHKRLNGLVIDPGILSVNYNSDSSIVSDTSKNNLTRTSSNKPNKCNTIIPSLAIDSSSEFLNTFSCSDTSDEFTACTKNNVDSDNDDIIECSIEEPRRSRRLAERPKKY